MHSEHAHATPALWFGKMVEKVWQEAQQRSGTHRGLLGTGGAAPRTLHRSPTLGRLQNAAHWDDYRMLHTGTTTGSRTLDAVGWKPHTGTTAGCCTLGRLLYTAYSDDCKITHTGTTAGYRTLGRLQDAAHWDDYRMPHTETTAGSRTLGRLQDDYWEDPHTLKTACHVNSHETAGCDAQKRIC